MKIQFLGAVRAVTGSMHLLEIGNSRLVLDCGLFQGRRKEAFERNRRLPIAPEAVDAVILSHAHIDHSGNIPTLVKQGFKGRIFATPATRDLCDIMLADSAYLQVKDVEFVNKKRAKQGKAPFEPLYTPEDVPPAMARFRAVPYGAPEEILPGVTATFHDAGHLLGSAVTRLEIANGSGGVSLIFTGDLGRPDMPILRDPQLVLPADILITESTYGDRLHPPKADVKRLLSEVVMETVKSRGKLIIPAFSVGRTQQILYFLRELYTEKAIPDVPVVVDSPLSAKATEQYARHPECYDPETLDALASGAEPFTFKQVRFTVDTDESKAINDMPGPLIIVSASGMCEGGRVLHHLAHNIANPSTRILFVGYQAEHTLGRRLIEHADPIRIFGEEYHPLAQTRIINALSAHADRDEMLDYFGHMSGRTRKTFVVHGEEGPSMAFAESLRQAGMGEVTVPEPMQTFDI
ncbi:MAG TPA: MBL fold metallo-hydrolase [Candidatus Brocadiia bacterium]|nr:MBL fold metallo-hydrolase [Candidatus Brocadiia bacterium]